MAKKKTLPTRKALIAKLDRTFSKYIRLRDTHGGEYFRCISCGKIKTKDKADCGHFFSRRRLSVRWDEKNCHAECSHCLTPDALILTKDLTWVKLGDIKTGDRIFAFDEHRGNKLSRHWKEGIVTHIHREVQDVFRVELDNGDVLKTTAEHKWLARQNGKDGFTWVSTQDLWVNDHNLKGLKKTGPHTENTTSVVCKPILQIHHDTSYESGWLAGMIDADGHLCQQNINNPDGTVRYGFRIGIAQSETYPKLCTEIVRLLEKFTNNRKPCRQFMQRKSGSFNSTVQTWQFIVTGTNIEKIHFLMKVRPNKMSKLDINKLGCIRSRYDTKVKSITPIGKNEIVVMETDTHTFIANGYAMHNCNRFDSEHLLYYRENLIKKIGEKEFEALEIRANQTSKISDFEIDALNTHYNNLIKLLEKTQKSAERQYNRMRKKDNSN